MTVRRTYKVTGTITIAIPKSGLYFKTYSEETAREDAIYLLLNHAAGVEPYEDNLKLECVEEMASK